MRCNSNADIRKAGVYKAVHCGRLLEVQPESRSVAVSQKEERKMPLPILLNFAIFSALSIATLGQTISNTTQCNTAIANFEQDSSCFGTSEGLDAFRSQLNPNNSLANPAALLSGQLQQMQAGLTTFFSSFCPSQQCVNSYANVARNCIMVRSKDIMNYNAILYASVYNANTSYMYSCLVMMYIYIYPVTYIRSLLCR